MGLTWHDIRALISARKAGIEFGRTLTVGRLNLFISPFDLKDILRKDMPSLLEKYDQFMIPHPSYVEPLLKLMGAKEVLSLDASNYEGASIIHDMNQPISPELKGTFDFVNDGGTLEHVFNFPTAIKNCMELVKIGGHLMINTPANNNFGHGFYQFSPELFFRVLCPDNGFKVERMVAFEHFDGSQWFEVADPDQVRSRVELLNPSRRVQLLVRAVKTHQAEVFAKMPQQSDYSAAWDANAATDTGSTFLREPSPLRVRFKKTIESLSPSLMLKLRRLKNARLNRRFSFEKQRQFFTPVKE
jgi:SAM-dependent methyltransferase